MAGFRLRCTQCGGDVPIETGNSDSLCRGCGARYPQRDGIVQVTPDTRDEDYPEPLVDLVADVQDRHFWFAARNDVIVSTMRRTIGSLEGRRVLEVGCGTGAVLPALERAGMVACGIDMHRQALLHARRRTGAPLVWTNAASLPFFADFDAVLLCDVIEHVDDDVAVLVEARRVLKPGGSVVVTVPAGPDLWTVYDEVVGHKRRYDREGLEKVMRSARFSRQTLSYFNLLPLIVQRLHRRVTRARGETSRDAVDIVRRTLTIPPAPLNGFLGTLMRTEAAFSLPSWVRGGSLVAVGWAD